MNTLQQANLDPAIQQFLRELLSRNEPTEIILDGQSLGRFVPFVDQEEIEEPRPWRGVFADVIPAKPIQNTIPQLELPPAPIAPNFEFLIKHEDA